jgi:hypothetical protein
MSGRPPTSSAGFAGGISQSEFPVSFAVAMKPTARMVALLSLLIVTGWAPARPLELEVTGLDGSSVRGRVVQVLPEITLATSDGESVLAWTEVLALRPRDAAGSDAPTFPQQPFRFELGDGSTFGGRIETATERGIVVHLSSRQTCRLDLSLLRAVRSTSASPEASARLQEVAADANGSDDVAVVQRGTRVIVLRGAVRRVDSQRVVFAWKERELPLPWERVAGLHFARSLERQARCTVHLRGGDIFCGRVIAGNETSLALQSGAFDRLELPWSRIDRVECRSPRLTFLSDLAAARYEFTPFFQKHWNYARDRTLTGGPIRLAGRGYEKGIAMHSRSLLTYALDGRYRQFAAVVGIADDMADRGDVTLAVLGDGRVLWEARNVHGGEPPRDVLADVTGVRELSLHVNFGDELDLSDHVCWAMARLIR